MEPTTITADLEVATQTNGIEAALRAAARPVRIELFNDERSERHIIAPPDWQHIPVEPEPPRTAPDRQKGAVTVHTAAGFAEMVTELADGKPCRFTADMRTMRAVIAPGSIGQPAFDDLTVTLQPELSDELTEWTEAGKVWIHDPLRFGLDAWVNFIEDHQADIDAAAEDPTAPGFLDVIQDARTWNVEARRARKRITDDKGGVDDADEYKATVIGKALSAFKISIPVLRFGSPVTLVVAIQRDLDEVRIAPRLPGIRRVIDAAIFAEISEAEAEVGQPAIR